MATMRTHELHPALVHAPLALLPAAAIVDVYAVLRPRDRALDRFGRTLWWSTAFTAAAAGVTGMAASQEIELSDDTARDMMWLHGAGNATLLLAALGMATLRSGRRASLVSALAGLAASGAATYTAWLGGQLVYAHGAGVKRPGATSRENPPLFSAEGPGKLLRDAYQGLRWILSRGRRIVSGEERLQPEALGPAAALQGGDGHSAGPDFAL